MCCHDGVYLMPGEEEFLVELLVKVPRLRRVVPEMCFVDGFWEGQPYGRKTETRPWDYANPEFPAHFTRTRCVFGDAQGYCELEKLARSLGMHPWTFKPSTCWLFPLHARAGEAFPPPILPMDDPYRNANYAGFVTFVPCGKHDPAGSPWRACLNPEIQALSACSTWPLLGSDGHRVEDLLRNVDPCALL